ncbi:MAG: hypothetical protein IPI35_19785 [Deltaproteobacteria bacterium]|nr:hypothetical protein [Deltaproteobacteria bacterium]
MVSQDLQDTQTALFNLGTFAVVQTCLPDLSVPSNTIPVEVRVTGSRFRRARFGGGFSFERATAPSCAPALPSRIQTSAGASIRLEAAAEGGVKGFTQNGQASAFTLVSATRGIFEDRTEALDSVTAATSSRFEGGPVASPPRRRWWCRRFWPARAHADAQGLRGLDRDVGQVTRSPGGPWRSPGAPTVTSRSRRASTPSAGTPSSSSSTRTTPAQR